MSTGAPEGASSAMSDWMRSPARAGRWRDALSGSRTRRPSRPGPPCLRMACQAALRVRGPVEPPADRDQSARRGHAAWRYPWMRPPRRSTRSICPLDLAGGWDADARPARWTHQTPYPGRTHQRRETAHVRVCCDVPESQHRGGWRLCFGRLRLGRLNEQSQHRVASRRVRPNSPRSTTSGVMRTATGRSRMHWRSRLGSM
jgi:hypothetical protein